MINKKTKFLIAGIFLMVIPISTFAIGMMTKPIVFENVLRGQTVEETLTVLNSDDQDIIYQLSASGEIKEWTKFYQKDDKNLENPITEISVPANSKLNLIVAFTIPEDTPNGTYTGEVAIATVPGTGNKEKMSVSIAQRVSRQVSIAVTDKEILDFDTSIIPNKYSLASGDPLIIKVIYTNNGNVSIKPDIHLKIIRIKTGEVIHNAIYPYPENEAAVKPFERKILPEFIKWQTAGYPKERYRAEIEVLLNGKKYFEKSFRFRVGVDIMELLLASIGKLGGGNILLGWFVLGAIFLFLAAILTILTQNRKLGEKIKSMFKNLKINRYL